MYRLSQNQTVCLVQNHVELCQLHRRLRFCKKSPGLVSHSPLDTLISQKVLSFLFSVLTLTMALSTSAELITSGRFRSSCCFQLQKVAVRGSPGQSGPLSSLVSGKAPFGCCYLKSVWRVQAGTAAAPCSDKHAATGIPSKSSVSLDS